MSVKLKSMSIRGSLPSESLLKGHRAASSAPTRMPVYTSVGSAGSVHWASMSNYIPRKSMRCNFVSIT